MKKFKNQAGYTVYECTEEEVKKMFSLEKYPCDDCGIKIMDEGYLIPARNVFLCIICYKDFCEKKPTYNEDDRDFENTTIEHYESLATKNNISIL